MKALNEEDDGVAGEEVDHLIHKAIE